MSERKPGEGAYGLIEEALDEAEVERLAGLSREKLHEEMKGAGLDPADARRLLDQALGARGEGEGGSGQPPAGEGKVVSLDRARAARRRIVPLLALAAAASVPVVVFVERQTLVAWIWPGPSAPPPSPRLLPSSTGPREPTPEEIAARIRDEALDSCAKGYLGECSEKLDEAKKLDPEGEEAPRVRLLRDILSRDKLDNGEDNAKVPLGPGERPLAPRVRRDGGGSSAKDGGR